MIEEFKEQIQQDIGNSRIHVYMKGTPLFPMCGFSKTTCEVFNALGATFTSTNVLDNLPDYRAALQETTNWPTIPQVFIGGEFVGGCDIIVEMYQAGELQGMLADAGEPVEASPAAASSED